MKIRKLGTVDCDIVETNPVVWQGRLLRFEYIRWKSANEHYYANYTGKSYFRFVDHLTGEIVTPPFGAGLHLGNAFVHGDTMVVTAAEDWGKSRFYQLESKDLVHWSEPRVILEGAGWEGYNTSVCQAGDRFIMTFELGAPRELVNVAFTMLFAESTDLVHWTMLPDKSFFKDIYTGGPMLRWFDGVFYFFYLAGDYQPGFQELVARSTDLLHWENSPQNPVMTFDEDDRKLYGPFTPSLQKRIAEAVDINVSDMDMCDYDGKLRISYSWGNQRGTEFLAIAEADTTEKEFCQSFFGSH